LRQFPPPIPFNKLVVTTRIIGELRKQFEFTERPQKSSKLYPLSRTFFSNNAQNVFRIYVLIKKRHTAADAQRL